MIKVYFNENDIPYKVDMYCDVMINMAKPYGLPVMGDRYNSVNISGMKIFSTITKDYNGDVVLDKECDVLNALNNIILNNSIYSNKFRGKRADNAKFAYVHFFVEDVGVDFANCPIVINNLNFQDKEKNNYDYATLSLTTLPILPIEILSTIAPGESTKNIIEVNGRITTFKKTNHLNSIRIDKNDYDVRIFIGMDIDEEYYNITFKNLVNIIDKGTEIFQIKPINGIYDQKSMNSDTAVSDTPVSLTKRNFSVPIRYAYLISIIDMEILDEYLTKILLDRLKATEKVLWLINDWISEEKYNDPDWKCDTITMMLMYGFTKDANSKYLETTATISNENVISALKQLNEFETKFKEDHSKTTGFDFNSAIDSGDIYKRVISVPRSIVKDWVDLKRIEISIPVYASEGTIEIIHITRQFIGNINIDTKGIK